MCKFDSIHMIQIKTLISSTCIGTMSRSLFTSKKKKEPELFFSIKKTKQKESKNKAEMKNKTCNKLSKVLVSECHIRLHRHFIMLQAPLFTTLLAGNTLKYVCSTAQSKIPLHWIIYKNTEGSDWTDRARQRNSLTLLSHCTVNTSMLADLFSDNKEEGKGE